MAEQNGLRVLAYAISLENAPGIYSAELETLADRIDSAVVEPLMRAQTELPGCVSS